MPLARRDLLMALASTPFPALAQSDAPPTTRDILKERIEVGRRTVGLVALTTQDGRRELVTWGQSGRDGVALDGDTVFEAGSITKVFTALLLADMVQRRELALDDPVASLLPAGTKIPERGKPITLLDLATYSSGLPNLPGNFKPGNPDNPYLDYTPEKMLAFLASYELPHEPGTHYEYANLGFALLGHALAARAGKPWEALVLDRICAPLGLADTRITPTPSMAARRAQGHDTNLVPVPDWEFDAFAGSGALHSTASDLARFVEAASGQRPSPLHDAFALLLATRRPADHPAVQAALGWFVVTGRTDEIVQKTGGTAGTRSFFGWSLKSRRGAVLLSNANLINQVDDIAFHLINPATPLKPQRRAVALAAAQLERLVGGYKAAPFGIAVSQRGDRLFAKVGTNPLFEVFAASETEFFYRVVEAGLSFELGPDGRATAVVLHAEDKKDYRGLRQ